MTFAASGQAGAGSFEAFRAARMRLPAEGELVSLVAVGDVMLSRGVAGAVKAVGDPAFPFAAVQEHLRQGDLVFGNLEGPLTPGRPIDISEMVLRADPVMAGALAQAGFTVLSLANNHIPDFGPRGITDTLQNLERAGVTPVGAGRDDEEALAPRFFEVKGMRFAFLAFGETALLPKAYRAGPDVPGTAATAATTVTGPDAPGTAATGLTHARVAVTDPTLMKVALTDPARMRAAIAAAAAMADFVVVSLHAGTEYELRPDSVQTVLAYAAIDAGASLVLGHHPHVVQPIEQYRGKYILYSLGNFIFDQLWSEETRRGLLVRFLVSKAAGVVRMELVPTRINAHCQPEAMTGPEADALVQRLGLDITAIAPPATEELPRKYVAAVGATPPARRLVEDRDFDLDRDGATEHYALRDGRLTVSLDPLAAGSRSGAGGVIWQTPEDWWVEYFLLGDADNDGTPDLNLSVWKAGSFGLCRPFWVERDDPTVRNHLFIFDLVGGRMKAVWQSSNLDRPNLDLALEDLDGDGQNELVTLEGSYSDPQRRQITAWKWNGWGFSRVN